MEQSVSELGECVKSARRNTISDVLRRTSAKYPDKLAFCDLNERLTYQQFNERVNKTARAFLADGIQSGDKIAVLSRNSLDYAVTWFAIARIGAVMVPMNYMLNVSEIAYILNHASVRHGLASGEFADALTDAAGAAGITLSSRFLMDCTASEKPGWTPLGFARANLSADDVDCPAADEDVVQILYTSGTESRPKGVMLTHQSLASEYISCIVDGRMEHRDVAIHALPLYHSAQMHCFLGPSVYIGGTGIIIPHASPDAILDVIEREHATQLFCPPTVWISLLRHPSFQERDLSSLEKCYYGAAIMPMEVLKELSVALPRAQFFNFYGQTEVAPLATVLKPEDQMTKLGSAGKPALHVETRIVDDNGDEVPRNTVGEIVHRTPHAMLGYLNDPVKTTEAFAGGWFHSGDLGVMDEDGYITVVDRKKDMIKTGGVNVSSREVEEVIYEFDGVSEVAVIAIPDDYWIEAVTAVIVPKTGERLDTEQLREFCRERLASYKVPKHFVLLDTLPRNPSGKILKRQLRDTYAALAKKSDGA